jgi:hypothetical protein
VAKKKRKQKTTTTPKTRAQDSGINYSTAVSSRISHDDGYSSSADLAGYLRGLNVVASKIPFQIYDVVDNLVLLDPYVNKYHHTTIALGNSGHDLVIYAPSQNRALEAIQAANDLAERCFPFGGGMSGMISGCFSQLARTTATCVEWVPDIGLTQIRQGFLVPIKTIRFVYGNDGGYILCQQQDSGVVQLNTAQTIYFNAMVKDGNPYAVPPIISAIQPCATHRAVVDKIALWMDKLAALGVMLAEVEPPPRLPGETQEVYDEKSKVFLDKLAKSIGANMSSGLGVAYNNVKFQFQNTQAGASGAKELVQMVLQGVFAGLQRDPIMFGWNFGNSDAFVKVIYEELMQSLAFYQRGVKKVIEQGHRLNLALMGLGDCKLSVDFHASRSLDQFRDSEAEYMDSKKILEQLVALAISPEEARRELGYDRAPLKDNSFTATFSQKENKYELLSRDSHIYPVPAQLQSSTTTNYENDIQSILKRADNAGMSALAMWLSLQGNFSRDTVVREGLDTYLNYAEKAINEKEVASLAAIGVRNSWEEGQGDPVLFSKIEKDRIKNKKSDEELAAMAYLALTVDPYMVKHYLSRSEWRVRRLGTTLAEMYDNFGMDNPTNDKINAFRAAVAGYTSAMASEAAVEMGDITSTRARTWGALYALRDSGVERFMVVGPEDDRKCSFCFSMLGKIYEVRTEISNIEEIVRSRDPEIGAKTAFLTKQYGGKEGAARLANMSSEEIQDEGLSTPPYHVNCRDSLVAVL